MNACKNMCDDCLNHLEPKFQRTSMSSDGWLTCGVIRVASFRRSTTAISLFSGLNTTLSKTSACKCSFFFYFKVLLLTYNGLAPPHLMSLITRWNISAGKTESPGSSFFSCDPFKYNNLSAKNLFLHVQNVSLWCRKVAVWLHYYCLFF